MLALKDHTASPQGRKPILNLQIECEGYEVAGCTADKNVGVLTSNLWDHLLYEAAAFLQQIR